MLRDHLNGLESAGLIRQVEGDPELAYLFRHALVQEAAYASLLKEERRRLHQVVGQALEALYPRQEELAATLAYHYSMAEDHGRALRYLLRAGDAALARYAVAEAVLHYRQAMEAAGRIGKAAEVPWLSLYRNLGRALELDVQYEEAIRVYEEMAGRARARGDQAMEVVALTEHAKVHATPGKAHNAAEGRALAERALALAREVGDREAEARIEWVLMIVSWLTRAARESLDHGERSLALARELDLREQLAYTLQDMHRPLANLGHFAAAQGALESSRALWRELHNLPMLADNLASTADLLATLGQLGPALEFAGEAYRLSQSIGNLWNQAFGRAMMGEIYQVRGELSAAEEALREAYDLSARAGLVILYLRVCRRLAELYIEVDDPERARRLLRQSLDDEHLDASLREAFRPDALLTLSYLEVHAGRPEAAQAVLDALLQERPDLSSYHRILVAWVQAELSLARGQHEGALAVVDDLLERFGPGTPLPQRLRLEHLRARALLGLGRAAEAAPLLRAAAEQAAALGLRSRLWPILDTLVESEALLGNAAAAAAAGQEAGRVVAAIAGGIVDPRMRESFLRTCHSE